MNVVDRIAPVITIAGDNPAEVELGTTYTDAGASASDLSTVSLVTDTSNVDTDISGSYTVTYTATDASGNSSTATRTVNVVDTTAPTITIIGDNPATVEYKLPYTDAGASASDLSSFTLTTTSDVNTDISGSYTVTYTATDASGNSSTATRTVNVVDSVSPTVSSFVISPSQLLKGETATVTIVFSEAVSNFNSDDDVTVQNGTLTQMTSSDNITWTGTYTPTDETVDFENKLTLANTYTDVNNNDGTGLDSNNYEIETTRPTVSSFVVTSNSLELDSNGDVNTSGVTLEFSEAIPSFDSDTHITVPNGSLSTMTSSDNITWTGTYTPFKNIIDSSNELQIDSSYTDASGNNGSSANSNNFSISTPTLLDPHHYNQYAMRTLPEITVGSNTYVPLQIKFPKDEYLTGFLASFSQTVTFDTTNSANSGLWTFTNSGTTSSNSDNTSFVAASSLGNSLQGTNDFQTVLYLDNTNTGSLTANSRDILLDQSTALNTSTNLPVCNFSTTTKTGEQYSASLSTYHVNNITSFFGVDTASPHVKSFTLSDTELTSSDTATVTLQFSEAVSSFNSDDDITVQNGTLTQMTSSDNVTWTGTFTPSSNIFDHSNKLTLSTSYTDIAGNSGAAAETAIYTINNITLVGDSAVDLERLQTYSDQGINISNDSDVTITTSNNIDNTEVDTYTFTYTITHDEGNVTTLTRTVNVVDTTPPTVDSFTISDSQLKIGDTATVTLTFSEAVSNFNSDDDITVQNGTLTQMTSSDNTTWTGTFTPTNDIEDLSNVLTLANTYTDVNNVTGPSATTSNYEIDTLSPTVSSFTISDSQLKKGDTATVTIVFSEAVSGFNSNDDITVENGSLSLMTSSDNTTWTGTFTPTDDTEDLSNVLTLGTTYTDLSGNSSVQTYTVSYEIDTKNPVITILGDNPVLVELGADYTSTEDAGVTVSDLSYNNVLTTVITVDTATTDNNNNYYVTYTATDVFGNSSTAIRYIHVVDRIAPTITVEGDNPYTLERTQDYVDSTAGGISVTDLSTTFSSLTIADPDTSNINKDVSGNYTVTYTVTDSAGNVGTATRDVYVRDSVPPSVSSFTLSRTSFINGQEADIAIQFSEPVSNFSGDYISLDNGQIKSGTLSSSDNINWTATFEPNTNNSSSGNKLTILTGVEDAYGNASTQTFESSTTYSIDTVAPTVLSFLVDDTSFNRVETATVTITFSEKVVGFTVDDIEILRTGSDASGSDIGSLAHLSTNAAQTIYNFTFTPTQDIILTDNLFKLSLDYLDASGNSPEVRATSSIFDVDTSVPVVQSFVMSDTQLIIGDTSTVTIQFDKEIIGLSKDDITVENGSLSELTTSNNTTWTCTFTPTSNITDATNTLVLSAGTYTDLVGNLGPRAETANFTIDTVRPTVISFTISDTELKFAEAASVVIVFSEKVLDFSKNDITIGTDSSGNFVGELSDLVTDDNITWNSVFTPRDLTYVPTNVLTIPGDRFTDVEGNTGVTASTTNFIVNTVIDEVTYAIMEAFDFDSPYDLAKDFITIPNKKLAVFNHQVTVIVKTIKDFTLQPSDDTSQINRAIGDSLLQHRNDPTQIFGT